MSSEGSVYSQVALAGRASIDLLQVLALLRTVPVFLPLILNLLMVHSLIRRYCVL